MASAPDVSPFSPSALGQLIAQVGFPVVAAFSLAWVVWVLTHWRAACVKYRHGSARRELPNSRDVFDRQRLNDLAGGAA
jgi:hypothetical protein